MAPHVAYVLVAEFDIDKGAIVAQQYPHPTGTDEQILAESMLPEGVHLFPEDWTIFFLNQSPANALVPYDDGAGLVWPPPRESKSQEVMYVLSLVRTKRDDSVRRGAVVKALAVCTHLPYFQIFKPVLLIALDKYYENPTESCVKDIFDTLNSLDLSMVPSLTWHEKLVMRLSERNDVFGEKFARRSSRELPAEIAASTLNSASGAASTNSSKLNESYELIGEALTRSRSTTSLKQHQRTGSSTSADPPSDISHNSSGSVVWVGEESQPESLGDPILPNNSSIDALRSRDDLLTISSDSGHFAKRRITQRDTHFYETSVKYANIPLPIKVPVSAFTEEVGDFSLSELIKIFSSAQATINGPLHPHLHTNGSQTHPVILIFNAIITQKRVIFIGHQKQASAVANCVLAACALASGSGCYLRGFIERAFPYVNLSAKDILDPFASTGYIAGVTNPIFENLPMWDVLCNIVTSVITVHKDISTPAPPPNLFPVPPTLYNLAPKSGIIRVEGSAMDDDFGRMTPSLPSNHPGQAKADFVARQDSYDVLFMEDIQASIANHVGEMGIRARFAEYVYRFIQLASRYEEDTLRITNNVWYPCTLYISNGRTGQSSLGSGIRFGDEVEGLRELSINGARIEGWRNSPSYDYWVRDFASEQETNSIKGFDIEHQIVRLRKGKNLPEGEVALILKTICENVGTYDQVVELLSHCPPHHGGLQPLAMGLFHQQEYIRDMTVGLLNVIRDYSVGFQSLQSLNQFFRYSYIRQVHDRQLPWRDEFASNGNTSQKAPSNHSQVSLGAL